MFTLEEIGALVSKDSKEFAKNWEAIADSSLKLLGAREMTPEDKAELELKNSSKD